MNPISIISTTQTPGLLRAPATCVLPGRKKPAYSLAIPFLLISWLVSGCSPDRSITTGFAKPESLQWSEQGWSETERERWHHLNSGQQFAPLSWLKALRVPGAEHNLLQADYLRELGFLDKPVSTQNPEGLPVGFALTVPRTGESVQVGLSCAACHTGQINSKGQALRIDGGSAGSDLIRYFTDYNLALGAVFSDPGQWADFVKRVQALESISEDRLRQNVQHSLSTSLWDLDAKNKAPGNAVEAGHGRMDPFNRIGNQLLGLGLLETSNYHAWNAPVSVPHMWDVPKFDWVHYNASFTQPIARNILQVLGNGGTSSFLDKEGQPMPAPQKWQSNIDVEGLVEMEYGYSKLKTPKWPSKMLGAYDVDLARQGRHLFTTHCASCHAPRPLAGGSPGFPQLAVKTIPLNVIGTDPTLAQTFRDRRYKSEKLLGNSSDPIDGPTGLTLITSELAKAAYDKLGYSVEQRARANGNRPNRIRALAVYKARPLDGVWSTAPFLHNGSIPNVYELLSLPSERSSTFWLGTYEYDAVKLGYVTGRQSKGFEFDTRLPGNSNGGHVFSNDKTAKGVIGPALSHGERMALIEYLKALPDMPPDPLPEVAAN